MSDPKQAGMNALLEASLPKNPKKKDAEVTKEPKTEPKVEPKSADEQPKITDVDDDFLASAGIEKPVEETVESKSADWTDDVSHKNDGARQNFERIKTERDEARAEIAKLKQQLESGDSSSDWKAKYEEAQKIVEEVQFTKSDYYQENHVKPLRELGDDIELTCKDYGLSVEVLKSLATATPQKRLAILDSDVESPTLRSILANKFSQVDALRRKAQNAIAQSEERAKARIVDENTHIHADKDIVSTAIDTYFEKHQDNLFFKTDTSNESWNKLSSERRSSVAKMSQEMNPDMIAKGFIALAQIDTLTTMLENERKRRADAEAQLAEVRGGEPSVKRSRNSDSNYTKNKKIDFTDARSVSTLFTR